MARKSTPGFFCTDCGHETARWEGRCPGCGAWNTLAEAPQEADTPATAGAARSARRPAGVLKELAATFEDPEVRVPSGIEELDRVLGGGLVRGSLVLVGGDPGIGKSTLLLQAAEAFGRLGRTVAYVTAEESARQVKLRADRLRLAGDGVFVLAETDLDRALSALEGAPPDILIVDSIQTVHSAQAAALPGSVGQVKHCASILLDWAKSRGVSTFLVGHVTKEGDIAGPRTLEHLVDAVLYLEGERYSSYRVLRSVKNRYGAATEVGVFEMRDKGLTGVPNPSAVFLQGRDASASGTAVSVMMEGTRPLAVEIQALVTPTPFPAPRRLANGLDSSRLLMVTAVLTKRLGLNLAQQDVVANVVGGLRVDEPAADLALAAAITSSCRDVAVRADAVLIGEVGLAGELRTVSQLERRVAEAGALGVEVAIVGGQAPRRVGAVQVLTAGTLREAIGLALAGQAPS
jgi:DNA repair protein RadA/Sms